MRLTLKKKKKKSKQLPTPLSLSTSKPENGRRDGLREDGCRFAPVSQKKLYK